MRTALRRFYGHRWRTVLRPETLHRDNYKCVRCGMPWTHKLDVAHLDGDPSNNAPENRAALCRRCHRAHDYQEWLRKRHETMAARKDARRPILQFGQDDQS